MYQKKKKILQKSSYHKSNDHKELEIFLILKRVNDQL